MGCGDGFLVFPLPVFLHQDPTPWKKNPFCRRRFLGRHGGWRALQRPFGPADHPSSRTTLLVGFGWELGKIMEAYPEMGFRTGRVHRRYLPRLFTRNAFEARPSLALSLLFPFP